MSIRSLTDVHLTHCDPTREMRRFYRLEVQPDLFGALSLIREWGRIGRGGRITCTSYATRGQRCSVHQTHDIELSRKSQMQKRRRARPPG